MRTISTIPRKNYTNSRVLLRQAQLISDSYRRIFAQKLPNPAELCASETLCVLSHDTGDPPRFNFANIAACKAFHAHLDELLGMPSAQSAGPQDVAERQAMLDAVHKRGFVHGYRGLRRTLRGAFFHIEDATIFNLQHNGAFCGQAVVFPFPRSGEARP